MKGIQWEAFNVGREHENPLGTNWELPWRQDTERTRDHAIGKTGTCQWEGTHRWEHMNNYNCQYVGNFRNIVLGTC